MTATYHTDTNMRCQDGHLLGWLADRRVPDLASGDIVLVRDITDEFQLRVTVVDISDSGFCGFAHWDTLEYQDEQEGW